MRFVFESLSSSEGKAHWSGLCCEQEMARDLDVTLSSRKQSPDPFCVLKWVLGLPRGNLQGCLVAGVGLNTYSSILKDLLKIIGVQQYVRATGRHGRCWCDAGCESHAGGGDLLGSCPLVAACLGSCTAQPVWALMAPLCLLCVRDSEVISKVLCLFFASSWRVITSLCSADLGILSCLSRCS